MFGKNSMRFAWSGVDTLKGSSPDHWGQGTSFGSGNDLKFNVGTGTDTMVFTNEVSNLKFSIYDLDLQQRVIITATNAAGTAQTITVVKDSTASTSQTIFNSGTTRVRDSSSSAAIALSNRGATANVTIAGPVKTVVLAFTKHGGAATDSIFISDITACNSNATSGTWPTNYQAINTPEAGQPSYLLANYKDSIVVVDITNNTSQLLYNDATFAANGINSLAYDPYNQYIYYSDNTRSNTNKAIYRYNVKTGAKTTWVADVTTLGIQLFSPGMGSGGASFYDGALFIGLDENLTNDEPVTVYKIEINPATGNATKALRYWSMKGYNTATGNSLMDWSDFVINNGILYNFNFSATAAPRTTVMHFDMNTMDTIVGYTGTTRSQVSIDYAGNIYHMTNGNRELYNGAGGYGALIPYTGTGSGSIIDAAESFKFPSDYSDAPNSYGVAYHRFSTNPKLKLGSTIDYEVNDSLNATASADDNYNTGATNDEDGKIVFNPISTSWYSYSTTLNVTNTTGASAVLYGFMDFDRNGTFDTLKNERSAKTTVANGATTATLTWYGLTGGSLGSSFVRFRLASSDREARMPFGYAADGEDEDYPFPINQVNLPVELVDFKGELKEDKTTLLTWSTASELNNDYFDIQRRKQDGFSWENIGKIDGFGNSNQVRAYNFIDKEPMAGDNYYRLNQVDYNGKSEFSPTVMVRVDAPLVRETQKEAFLLYPNPVKNEIWIKATENITADNEVPLDVYNITGEKVYSALMQENLQRLDLTQYQKGMYFIRIGAKSYRILKE